MKTSAKALASLASLFILAATLTGCGGAASAVTTPMLFGANQAPTAGMVAADAVGSKALAQLATIPVKGRAPKTGYTRAQFGTAWADVDRNGCDTRNDIMKRDLTRVAFKPGTRNCVVSSGTLADKYTGKTISFVRGPRTSSAVQIDHLIPLSLAWQTGAQQLSADARRQLANDPLNLMAAEGRANMQKSDSSADAWLPSNKSFRCEYVTRQTAVKAKYKLWMTASEHDTIARILATCK